MKFIPGILLWGYACFTLNAQQPVYDSIAAQPGDGIFSMLRKQGLDPVQHYADFVALNENNLAHGSQLKLGTYYKIPNSKSSLKKTGVEVQLTSGEETPIFNRELSKMNMESDKLKDAVYYLLIERHTEQKQLAVEKAIKKMAGDLMLNGAQVYLLEVTETERQQDSTEHGVIPDFGQCVELINKRFLKHGKKYQRVLLVRTNNDRFQSGKLNMGLYHYQKSEDGQRFAENIQRMFEKNRTIKRDGQLGEGAIFEDKQTLFLAKNLLPAITLLTLDGDTSPEKTKKIPVRVDESRFAKLLGNGLMKDYADLEIED